VAVHLAADAGLIWRSLNRKIEGHCTAGVSPRDFKHDKAEPAAASTAGPA
jgi:hypothetical protein